MLLNQQAGRIARNFVEHAKYREAAVKAMNASVHLTGEWEELEGGDKGGFNGSAVILGPGKEVSYSKTTGKWSTTNTRFTVMVSALHNLSVNFDKNKGNPPLKSNDITWNQAYADKFAEEVKILYGAGREKNINWGSDPQYNAAIDHVVPIFQSNVGAPGKMITIDKDHSSDGEFQLVNLKGKTTADGSSSGASQDGITPVVGKEADSWSYDVVLLLSKDVPLYTYATTQGRCDYMAREDLKSLSEKVVNDPSKGYGKEMTPVMGRDYRLLQTGYGFTSDNDVKVKTGKGKTIRPEHPNAGATALKFQYKRSQPKARATVEKFYLNSEYLLPNKSELVQTFSGGLALRCFDGNDSTYKGDSGGPLLAFPVDGGPVAYLVGVTLGAGLATSLESAKKKSVWEYDNNFATSLGYFYENLYDLRFQNV